MKNLPKTANRIYTNAMFLVGSVLLVLVLASCSQSAPVVTPEVAPETEITAQSLVRRTFEGYHQDYGRRSEIEDEARDEAYRELVLFERTNNSKCFDLDYDVDNTDWYNEAIYDTLHAYDVDLKAWCVSTNIYDLRIFNWQYYLSVNPDLRVAGLITQAQARQHWYNTGLAEGREGSVGYKGTTYVARYADLTATFTTNNFIKGADHYLTTFNTEDRRAGRVDVLSSAVFDGNYYLNRYRTEFAAAGITTAKRASQHWLEFGIYEGRQGSATFNVQTYLDRYADLRQAFAADTRSVRFAKAIQHFVEFGVREGRSGR
jgi:hypothetical protein